MFKRGDVALPFVVTTILIIAGFFIILMLLFNTPQTVDRDLCALSVVTRATVGDATQQAVPLQCTTEKICLSVTSSGDCVQYAGEEEVAVVRIGSEREEQKQKILETTANAMYDCWSMMGEGKLDLFGEYLVFNGKPTCVICSRLALGESVDENIDPTIGRDLDEYLRTTPVQGSDRTYAEAFTDREFQAYPQIVDLAAPDENKTLQVRGEGRQVAIVFSQIKSVDMEDAFRRVGTVAGASAGAAFIVPGSGKVARALLFNPVGGTIAGAALLGVGGVTAYTTYLGQSAAAGYCGKFTSTANEDAQEGCSVVQAIPYTVENINTICYGGIQGNL